MIVISKNNSKNFLDLMKEIFGLENFTIKHRDALNTYVLNIDYDKDLGFNTDSIVGNNMPYVGSAIVGSTYIA